MKLAYEAYDKSGKKVRNTIEAAGAAEATDTLRRQGLYVTEIKGVSGAAAAMGADLAKALGGEDAPTGVRRRKPLGTGRVLKNLTMFSRQLHVLVSTGTPLVEALHSIERQSKDQAWRGVVTRLRTRVEEGSSLGAAMEEFPDCFDAVSRSLVAAGETAGKLPAMLDRLATLTRKQQHVRSNVIGAMVYPILLINVAVGVLIVLLMFVLPRFGEMFKTMGMPLPPTTALLMGLSEFLLSYWWTVPFAVAGVIFAVRAWLKTSAGVLFVHTLALRFPQIGKIAQSFATARITRLMGILLDSYLPLLDVLQLVKESTVNIHYRNLLTRAEDAVTRGEPISTAFNDPSLIHPSVYEALRSGEASGQIAPLLLNISGFLDEDNDVVIKSLTSIIEPLILLVLGALVGFVAMSMFMPLFDLTAMTSSGGG